MTTLPSEFKADITLSPGECRALNWLTVRHPNTVIRTQHVLDQGRVGWVVARLWVPNRGTRAKQQLEYWLSPTGRVFKGEIDWMNSHFGRRTEEVVRDADYDR